MRGPALDIKARIHDRVAREAANRTWSPADFADLGPRVAVDTALHRLVAAGELRRVGRGLYDKPWTNPLTGLPSAPDVDGAIAAIARHKGLRYVVDGMTAANDLGLTNAVPAKTVVHVNARLKPVKLGNLEIVFRPASDTRLTWAGRPAMRLVQALHWFKDTLPGDEAGLMRKIRLLIETSPQGQAIGDDLKQGFAMLPGWMQEMLREIVFGTLSARRPGRPHPDNKVLTPKLEEFVRRKVTSGLYNNAGEVVRDGLRILAEREDAAGRRNAKPPDKDAIRSALASLEQPLRDKGVSSLSLFGSIIHGDARADSDIDVLIDVRPDVRFSLVSLVSLKIYLEERLGRPVDVVTRAGIEPAIREAVLGEAERVF